LAEGIIIAETRKLAAILAADMVGGTERLFDGRILAARRRWK
jgi:hypothetical protein